MTANYSNAHTHLYQPTIIENKLLLRRLAIQIAFVKNDPVGFVSQSLRDLLSTRNTFLALIAITAIVLLLVQTQRSRSEKLQALAREEPAANMVLLDVRTRTGRVGFNEDRGEGSGPSPRWAQGGGTGGNHNPIPPQTGKLPPPSPIPVAIPIAPPRALNTLPFGLTERAIAAARQIKFVPAMKDGRFVSVYMQLEYNFNLY